MSVFSGKCDLFDSLEIDASHKALNDIDELDYSKYKVCVYGDNHRAHEIKFDSVKDAMKYAPYLVVIGAHSDGKSNLILSSKDFITEEEEEQLGWRLDDYKRIRRSLKRKHLEVTPEAIKAKAWYSTQTELDEELIRRVISRGDKADFEGLHTPMAEYYRKRWEEALIDVGYTEYEAHHWVYGWR